MAKYNLPSTLTQEQIDGLGFTWDQVDQINVGTRSGTDYASPLRDEDESYGSTRVEYYTKVEDNDWSRYEFLGSIEEEGGFYEVRDRFWNELGEPVADLSALVSFSDISENFYNLEDSWTAIGDYLPDGLSFDNVANLAFSQDGDDFFIFNGDSSSDDYGVMLAE